jgi:hypothetical protein
MDPRASQKEGDMQIQRDWLYCGFGWAEPCGGLDWPF